MDFNQQVIEKVGPVLSRHGYFLARQFENYVAYSSQSLTISFTYIPNEKGCFSYISTADGKTSFAISDMVIRLFIMPLDHLVIPERSTEDYIENLIRVLTHPTGQKLLKGDASLIQKIENNEQQRAQLYTEQLIVSQELWEADAAWGKKDYKAVVNCIEKMKIETLPESWKMKYAIAKRESNS